MSVEIDPNMPGMDEASLRLDAMIAEESAATAATTDKTNTEASATQEQRTAQGEEDAALAPESQPTDTLATAEAAAVKPDEKKTEAKPADKPAEAAPKETKAEAEKSRYAKSQERLTKTWDAVNAEKIRLDAEKAKIEAERQEFARKQAEFEAIRKQAEQPAYKPEDYTNASRQKKQLADHQRAEADRLENAGKYDEAEKLRKQASKNDALSEDLAEHAENVRKNPPAGFTERAQQFEQARQSWTIEAAKAFPDLAKEGSAFQQTVAGHLQALGKNEPDLLAHPSVIYHVARLTAAEAKAQELSTTAARVPVLEKELGELKAKVKEYESLTTPASSHVAPKLGSTAANDEEAELERMAREVGVLSR